MGGYQVPSGLLLPAVLRDWRGFFVEAWWIIHGSVS